MIKEQKIFNHLLNMCIKGDSKTKTFKNDLEEVFFETKKLIINKNFSTVSRKNYCMIVYLYNMHADFFNQKEKPDTDFYKNLKAWSETENFVNAFDYQHYTI